MFGGSQYRVQRTYSTEQHTRAAPTIILASPLLVEKLAMQLRLFPLGLLTLCLLSAAASAQETELGSETLTPEKAAQPNDARLGPLKDLNGEFQFTVPASKKAWEQRSADLKRRILVATGLWPLPERTPLNPVIHSKMQRSGFTIEKVYFESMPNHYVTGLLFRPDDGQQDMKRPVVLCPHGHGGRLQDYGPEAIRQLIADGAERFEASGRFPKLARCASLARMGCVTFIFDMLGYADSQQLSRALAHDYAKSRTAFEGKENWGLFSAQAEMRLQSVMGIQTWNSIRCLDFLLDLPNADSTRVGVTGGSGGGTQTILLCAIDDRPTVAFPNGMVSTSMQGGCTCENCTLLRVGTGNVELAALFAPKPQAMTAANDWTKNMMADGYPALQKLYGMYGKQDDVFCRDLRHFPHNFNYVSRATMYKWFNKYLQLGHDEVLFLEEDFEPLFPSDASVWDDDQHPAPEGGDEYELTLTKYMAEQSDEAIAALTPTDAKSLDAYRRVVGGALETIVGRKMPQADEVEWNKAREESRDGYLYFYGSVRLTTHGEELPLISLFPTETDWNGDAVIWLGEQGKSSLFDDEGKLIQDVRRLVDNGTAILAADLFQQGDFLAGAREAVDQQRVVENPRAAAAYTFCYNHTLMAHRIHDVMTLIAYAHGFQPETPERVFLVASGKTAPIAAAARALSGDMVDRCALTTKGFRFADIRSYRDPSFLPGAVKYGDLPALLALNTPYPLLVTDETGAACAITGAAYSAADSEDAVTFGEKDVVDWLQ